MCRITPPPLRDFRRWWRSEKKCRSPPPPPPPRSSAFLGLPQLSMLAARRSEKCVVPPPLFLNPGSAPELHNHIIRQLL